jgi:hypothetical protein
MELASEQERRPQQSDFDFINTHPESMSLFEDAMIAHQWALQNCVHREGYKPFFNICKMRVRRFKRRTLAEARAALNLMIKLGLCGTPRKARIKGRRGRPQKICFLVEHPEPVEYSDLLLAWIRQSRTESGNEIQSPEMLSGTELASRNDEERSTPDILPNMRA